MQLISEYETEIFPHTVTQNQEETSGFHKHKVIHFLKGSIHAKWNNLIECLHIQT